MRKFRKDELGALMSEVGYSISDTAATRYRPDEHEKCDNNALGAGKVGG